MSTPERLTNRAHAVYYIYGPERVLLYIGRSVRPRARWCALRRENCDTWGQYVIDLQVRWFADFDQARSAEVAALRRHRPLCNPVIPEVDGRHVTTPDGRNSVRSSWDRLTALAGERGDTMTALVIRALEAEEYRLLREQSGR